MNWFQKSNGANAREKSAKAIGQGLLAFVAVIILGIDETAVIAMSPRDRVFTAIAAFLSVVVLHWVTWRYIVPARSLAPRAVTSFFPPRGRTVRRGFFWGTIFLGYLMVMVHCLMLAGIGPPHRLPRPIGLGMGLVLIALGTAGRLRDVFHAVTRREGAPPSVG